MTQKEVWIALLTLMCLLVPAAQADQQPSLLAMSFSPATRLLVVAPHPDDETLGAGGLIQRVRHAGGAVKVVFMTSGDGFPAGVALARHIQHPQAQDVAGEGQPEGRPEADAIDEQTEQHDRNREGPQADTEQLAFLRFGEHELDAPGIDHERAQHEAEGCRDDGGKGGREYPCVWGG